MICIYDFVCSVCKCMQARNNQPIKAAEKLIDVVIGQPFEVYEAFLEVVKQSNRTDILEIIVNSTFQGQLMSKYKLSRSSSC